MSRRALTTTTAYQHTVGIFSGLQHSVPGIERDDQQIMAQATVKWFNAAKSFGSISQDGGGKGRVRALLRLVQRHLGDRVAGRDPDRSRRLLRLSRRWVVASKKR